MVLQVGDQDRVKAFWTDTIGFELVQDAPYEQERWLEVRSLEEVNLVLELSDEGADGHAKAPADLPTSNLMFRGNDLRATYEELTARCVEFPQPPVEQPFGWWSMFNDSEGNRFALEQAGPDHV